MNCIERVDLSKIQYLQSLSFKDYKAVLHSSKNEKELKTQYDLLRRYCEEMCKGKGEFKRTYHHTLNTALEAGGRLFCGGSIQGFSKDIRGFLFCHTTDIDMVNAHPVILQYICRKHRIDCPNLSYYIQNRDTILQAFDDRDEGKTAFLKTVNSDKVNRKIKHKLFTDFDKECKSIQKKLTRLSVYSDIVDSVPESKLYNWYGSAINRILCFYENKILQVIIDTLAEREIDIASLMFDGLMVYGDYYSNNEFLTELQNIINHKFDDLNMQLSYKKHSTSIKLPDNYEASVHTEKVEDVNEFSQSATEFEKAHCKIINKSVFVKEVSDTIVIMSKPQIIASYEHLTYKKFRGGSINKVVDEGFIMSWLKENPAQRCYEDMGIFPDGIECPDNMFNLWRKFDMELVSEYEEKKDKLEIILNHIKILCGNDVHVAEYFTKWIAQLIQYPSVKTICPVFISREGAGKGTLLKLLSKMLGSKKVFESSNPSEEVWGKFNGLMANAFLVNLNELSKKDTLDAEGRIKAFMTDGKITINNKGVDSFEMNSYHRFIITTNNEEPINTTKDDRRKLIIRSSDEKCGDKAYFKELHDMLDDMNVVKTCYEYFKSIEGMENFNMLKIPETEYHNELKELKTTPIECWLKDLVEKKAEETELEYSSQKCYDLFVEWCSVNNNDYKCTKVQFCVRLKRLNLDGICIKKMKMANKTVFDIDKLKMVFGIGCLLV
jgi:hypothetical protein